MLAGAALAGLASAVGSRVTTASAAPARADAAGQPAGVAREGAARVGLLASRLEIASGSSQLVADFTWARQRALDWVQTGKPGEHPLATGPG